MLASLVATCKLNDVNPAAYIAKTLEAIIDGHHHSRMTTSCRGDRVAAKRLRLIRGKWTHCFRRSWMLLASRRRCFRPRCRCW
ncbi:transposase domain-containing protein [Bradyrhizobium tunisiense]|uniref:transposase domain-containing protein n=1 Tax=Bradyrhizobium tunisiense TaxID=3278709 RepID=UPI0035D60F0B